MVIQRFGWNLTLSRWMYHNMHISLYATKRCISPFSSFYFYIHNPNGTQFRLVLQMGLFASTQKIVDLDLKYFSGVLPKSMFLECFWIPLDDISIHRILVSKNGRKNAQGMSDVMLKNFIHFFDQLMMLLHQQNLDRKINHNCSSVNKEFSG